MRSGEESAADSYGDMRPSAYRLHCARPAYASGLIRRHPRDVHPLPHSARIRTLANHSNGDMTMHHTGARAFARTLPAGIALACMATIAAAQGGGTAGGT